MYLPSKERNRSVVARFVIGPFPHVFPKGRNPTQPVRHALRPAQWADERDRLAGRLQLKCWSAKGRPPPAKQKNTRRRRRHTKLQFPAKGARRPSFSKGYEESTSNTPLP